MSAQGPTSDDMRLLPADLAEPTKPRTSKVMCNVISWHADPELVSRAAGLQMPVHQSTCLESDGGLTFDEGRVSHAG